MSAIALENKTILVTGAAGFIGSNLVKRICEEVPSAKVVGIDSVNDYYDVALKEFRLNELSKYESFTFIKGNVLTKNALYAADVLLTPVKFDNFCRDNLAMVEDAYHELKEKNPELKWKVFANMVANVKAQKVSSADLLGKHDYPFLQSCISRTAIVDNALSLYKPVAKHRGGSNVAQDFVDLVDELLED